MKIKVKKYGPLNWRLTKDEESLNLMQSVSLEQLLTKELGIQPVHLKFLRVLLNGKTVSHLETKIQENDEIVLILPVGGG